MRGPSAGHGGRVATSRSALMASRSAATVGRLAEVETGADALTGVCSAGGAVAATELRGCMGCFPCTLVEGGAGGEATVVAVAVMEPDASRVTETLPDAVVMDAEPSPTVAVAVAVGGVAPTEAVAAEAARGAVGAGVASAGAGRFLRRRCSRAPWCAARAAACRRLSASALCTCARGTDRSGWSMWSRRRSSSRGARRSESCTAESGGTQLRSMLRG